MANKKTKQNPSEEFTPAHVGRSFTLSPACGHHGIFPATLNPDGTSTGQVMRLRDALPGENPVFVPCYEINTGDVVTVTDVSWERFTTPGYRHLGGHWRVTVRTHEGYLWNINQYTREWFVMNPT